MPTSLPATAPAAGYPVRPATYSPVIQHPHHAPVAPAFMPPAYCPPPPVTQPRDEEDDEENEILAYLMDADSLPDVMFKPIETLGHPSSGTASGNNHTSSFSSSFSASASNTLPQSPPPNRPGLSIPQNAQGPVSTPSRSQAPQEEEPRRSRSTFTSSPFQV